MKAWGKSVMRLSGMFDGVSIHGETNLWMIDGTLKGLIECEYRDDLAIVHVLACVYQSFVVTKRLTR